MYVCTYVSQFCHYHHHHHKREQEVKRGSREKIPTPVPPLLLLKLIAENVVFIGGQVTEVTGYGQYEQVYIRARPTSLSLLNGQPVRTHMLPSGRPQREGGVEAGLQVPWSSPRPPSGNLSHLHWKSAGLDWFMKNLPL